MADKIYSAKEAAIAVLKKAEEMLKNSDLMKARVDEGKSDSQKQQDRATRSFSRDMGVNKPWDKANPGMSTAGGNVRAAAATSNPKNKKFHTDAAKYAHGHVKADAAKINPKLTKAMPEEQNETPSDNVEQTPDPRTNPAMIEQNGNPAPGALPQNVEKYSAEMKGHIKLAKFVGGMEKKRSSKVKPDVQE